MKRLDRTVTTLGCQVSVEDGCKQVRRILRSSAFERANERKRLLKRIANATISGESRQLNECALAHDLWGFWRMGWNEPEAVGRLRSVASSLRSTLRQYYATEGHDDEIIVDLPVGAFTLVFLRNRSSGQPKTSPLNGRTPP